MAKQKPADESPAAPEPVAPAAGSGEPRFAVHVPAHGLPRVEVEAGDPAAAVEAYKAAVGVWHLPAEPAVEPAG